LLKGTSPELELRPQALGISSFFLLPSLATPIIAPRATENLFHQKPNLFLLRTRIIGLGLHRFMEEGGGVFHSDVLLLLPFIAIKAFLRITETCLNWL